MATNIVRHILEITLITFLFKRIIGWSNGNKKKNPNNIRLQDQVDKSTSCKTNKQINNPGFHGLHAVIEIVSDPVVL